MSDDHECKYRRACQRVMQALGPSVPEGVDYTDPANLTGLTAEIDFALEALREAGIDYKRRLGNARKWSQ